MGNEFNFILNTDAIIQQVLNQTNIQVSEAGDIEAVGFLSMLERDQSASVW